MIRENEEGSGEGQRRREVVRKSGHVKEWTRGVGWRVIRGLMKGVGRGWGKRERVGMGRFRRQKREAGESGAGWGSGEGQRGEGVGRRNNLTQN